MQVNFNPQQNNQQFGMAIHSNEVVNKIIKNRIKTPEQLERLSSIIDKAAENTTLDIHLYVNPDEKTIGANISSASDFGTRFHRCLSENWFSRTFGGGIVGFIEKCSTRKIDTPLVLFSQTPFHTSGKSLIKEIDV